MKCDEVQPLQGAYLDSELDGKTSLEIEQHLKGCPQCGRRFAEEAKVEARLTAGLNQGSRTPELWEEIERSVAAAASASAQPRRSQPARWRAIGLVLRVFGVPPLGGAAPTELFRESGWRGSRGAWAGLAAMWVVILALHFAAREPQSMLVAKKGMPSTSEIRFALDQKRVLMGDLAATSEPVPADKPKAAPPGPRSERRNQPLNS